MTRQEFASVMSYIGLAIRQELSSESMEVYFDLLQDLPRDVLQTAARRALLEHRWPTFPTVAELRTAAAQTQRGEVKGLSPAEAWGLAWRAVSKIDPEIGGPYHVGDRVYRTQADSILEGLPPLVREAIESMGLPSLCYGEPVGVIRGQFMKTFEQLAARDERAALLPASVKQAIEGRGAAPAALTNGIGRSVTE